MNNWRWAASRRWFGYLGMAIVFAIACALLSRWQFDRTAEASAQNRLVETNYAKDAVPVGSLLPELDSWDASLSWTPVTLQGTYLTDEQLLVRNRPYNGRPGFEVLVPLLLDDGSVFMVDRGWVASGDKQDSPDSIPAPPEGEIAVVARLRGSEPAIAGRSAPAGQLATVQLSEVDKVIDEPLYSGAYGLLESESPEPFDAAPLPAIKPELNEGMHLSYALQWILFALLGFFGLGWALRNEFRIRNADDPLEQERAARRAEKAARRGRTDAEVEDELVDSLR
jgi:cytochrome oxidase assembly protein ShyY1